MHQTTHFFNLGYGWLCKHCSAEAAERKHHGHHHGAQQPQGPALTKLDSSDLEAPTFDPPGFLEDLVYALL